MSTALLPALAGRRVFMTGHTGFKGSWLSIWLAQLGARVTGYALPAVEPSNFVASRVAELLDGQHAADVRDAPRLAAALQAAKPDIVLHLAAQALVRESYRTPQTTFETNVPGTVNLLEAVRTLARPCVVLIVTSDKCYAPPVPAEGHRETDALGGDDPYSASKACAEHVVAAYRRSFFPPERHAAHGVQLASVRAGNVIGGGDWAADRIVPDIMRHLVTGQPVPLRNPAAVRPWQHVLEPLGGYLALAARMLTDGAPRWSDAWNFGPLPGGDVSVAALTEQCIAAWGAGRWASVGDARQPPEAAALRLSIDKAVRELGWRPRWPLAETIQRTVQWYRAFYAASASDMRTHCLQDIAAYEQAGGAPAAGARPA